MRAGYQCSLAYSDRCRQTKWVGSIDVNVLAARLFLAADPIRNRSLPDADEFNKLPL